MKLNDVKHNHSLTDLLKILIFSILMMIPFIDVGIRCAYVVFNKNAYQSYSDQYVESAVNLDSSNINNLYVNGANVTYTFATHSPQWNATFGFSDISIDLNSLFNVQTTWNRFYLYKDSNNIMFYTTSNQTYVLTEQNRTFKTFTYTVDLTISNDKAIYDYGVATIINYQKDTLDNVFNYSVNKLSTNELYTWTQNTAIYTGVQTMCAQLGINNTVIPILLVYWFILTVIYIIIDIVLKLFTILTHAIGSKTA